MKIYKLLIIGLAFIAISCRSEKVKLNLFNIEKLAISYNFLLDEGFQKTEVDAMMFEKSVNDTTIYYEYTEDLKLLYSKRWRFPLKEFNRDELEKFLKDYNINLMIPNNFSLIFPNTPFCVISYNNNLIYFCSIEIVDKNQMFNIVYYYPQLME